MRLGRSSAIKRVSLMLVVAMASAAAPTASVGAVAKWEKVTDGSVQLWGDFSVEDNAYAGAGCGQDRPDGIFAAQIDVREYARKTLQVRVEGVDVRPLNVVARVRVLSRGPCGPLPSIVAPRGNATEQDPATFTVANEAYLQFTLPGEGVAPPAYAGLHFSVWQRVVV